MQNLAVPGLGEELVERETIFISHATPGDNAFTVWLASRLSLAGYDVWCDAEKLLGGEDFWKDIERVIRNKTAKFLLVISENTFDENGDLKSGVANELALANIVKKQITDDYFVVPVRIDGTNFSNFSIEFLRINGVDCSKNWADGLTRILEIFERDKVTHRSDNLSSTLASWREVHRHHTRALSDDAEVLQSNWLPITGLPETLYFYESPGVRWPVEPRAIASGCPLPCFDHGRLLVSFAKLDEMREALGEAYPIRDRGTVATLDFLRGRTGDISGISPRDAKNKVTSIIRQSWDLKMKDLGLRPYELANGFIAWWFPQNLPEDGQLRFTDFNGKNRKRVPTGIKGKKPLADGLMVPRYFWHLGFTARPMISNEPVMMLQPRVIITENGETPIANKTRLNSVRRSLTTMWFNDKWRGLFRGFVSWVSNDADQIDLPSSANTAISIGSSPVEFELGKAIASDPLDHNLSDESAEFAEKQEENNRLSDPVFSYLIDEEIDDE